MARRPRYQRTRLPARSREHVPIPRSAERDAEIIEEGGGEKHRDV